MTRPTADCITRAYVIGDSGERVNVSLELSKVFVEAFLKRGPGHPDFFSAANNLLCDLAERGALVGGAERLRLLAEYAYQMLGDSSLTAVRVAANAAAFSGISGDAELALELHQTLLNTLDPDFPLSDRRRIERNAAHWAQVVQEERS